MYFVTEQHTPLEQFNKYVEFFSSEFPKGFDNSKDDEEEQEKKQTEFRTQADAFRVKKNLTDKNINDFLDFLMTFKTQIL
jgi:hypothetical protein